MIQNWHRGADRLRRIAPIGLGAAELPKLPQPSIAAMSGGPAPNIRKRQKLLEPRPNQRMIRSDGSPDWVRERARCPTTPRRPISSGSLPDLELKLDERKCLNGEESPSSP